MYHFITGGGVTTPLGFQAAAVAADVKGNAKGKLDLALLVSDEPAAAAAVFTVNRVQAAPVRIGKELIAGNDTLYGVIVNSGNANACTGPDGMDDARAIANAAEKAAGLPKNSLLPGSTGVIGVRLPVARMLAKMDELAETLDDDASHDFAGAIMTTDTVPKETALLVETDRGGYVIGACAKGAGMIAPEMATMLAYITTDAMITKDVLAECLTDAVGGSFNRITVDGDMSTNDTVAVFANGMSGISVSHGTEKERFTDALRQVCLNLAKMIVKDGEGAEHLVTVEVNGAKSEDDAKKAAFTIANSPLVKTMLAGKDPNWGRLMASAGASGADFDEENVDIFFNDLHYAAHGRIIDTELESAVHDIMMKPEYTIRIDLGAGRSSFTAYTCDMTAAYIRINADYRT